MYWPVQVLVCVCVPVHTHTTHLDLLGDFSAFYYILVTTGGGGRQPQSSSVCLAAERAAQVAPGGAARRYCPSDSVWLPSPVLFPPRRSTSSRESRARARMIPAGVEVIVM